MSRGFGMLLGQGTDVINCSHLYHEEDELENTPNHMKVYRGHFC